MKPRTHFKHTIDQLNTGGEIIETVAGVDDYEIAKARLGLLRSSAARERSSSCAKGRAWCGIAGTHA